MGVLRSNEDFTRSCSLQPFWHVKEEFLLSSVSSQDAICLTPSVPWHRKLKSSNPENLNQRPLLENTQ